MQRLYRREVFSRRPSPHLLMTSYETNDRSIISVRQFASSLLRRYVYDGDGDGLVHWEYTRTFNLCRVCVRCTVQTNCTAHCTTLGTCPHSSSQFTPSHVYQFTSTSTPYITYTSSGRKRARARSNKRTYYARTITVHHCQIELLTVGPKNPVCTVTLVLWMIDTYVWYVQS